MIGLVAVETAEDWRAARFDDEDALSLHRRSKAARLEPDTFVSARVASLDRRQDAAFLDAGPLGALFLTAKDSARPLVEGQRLIVQVRRAAEDGKVPRVTAKLALAGRLLVYEPGGEGVSRARRLAKATLPQDPASLGLPPGGWRLRSAARNSTPDELRAEAERLRSRLAASAAELGVAPPGTVCAPWPAPEGLLIEALAEPVRTIAVADRPAQARLQRALAGIGAALPVEIAGDATARLALAIDEATARVAPFGTGGRLIVEPTAALTAIDVNAASMPAAKHEVNIAAAEAVARQLILRRTGGLIVVDFLDAPARFAHQPVERLRAALAADPAQVQVLPMSPFGLVEIKRERRGGLEWARSADRPA